MHIESKMANVTFSCRKVARIKVELTIRFASADFDMMNLWNEDTTGCLRTELEKSERKKTNARDLKNITPRSRRRVKS